MDEELRCVYFEEINTEVYGFSYHTTDIPENRLDHLKVPNNGRIHVLLGHGGDANHIPFDKAPWARWISPILPWDISTNRRY